MNELVEEIDRNRNRAVVILLVGFVVGLAVPPAGPIIWIVSLPAWARWARATWRLGAILAEHSRIPRADLRAVPRPWR